MTKNEKLAVLVIALVTAYLVLVLMVPGG